MLSMMIAAAALAGAPAQAPAPTNFIAQTVHVEGDLHSAFRTCLTRVELPRWRSLHRRKVIVSNAVYEKTGDLNNLAGPDWSHLVVSELKAGARGDSLIAGVARCAKDAGGTVVRAESMVATPNSYHPGKRLSEAPRRPDLAFLVEFIPVQPTKAALDEYREIMRTSIGPAMGRLVAEGAHQNLIALETTSGASWAPGAFAWNQIHIRGFYPDPGPTSPAMTRYMEEVNPALGGFANVFARLDAIRSKPRDAVARELVELRLERP